MSPKTDCNCNPNAEEQYLFYIKHAIQMHSRNERTEL